MALPSLQKTWFYNVNNKRGNQSNLAWHQNLMHAIHRALINDSPDVAWTDDTGAVAAPPGIWTVDHNCDSITAGTPGDAVDRYVTALNLIWDRPGDPHSWCVYNTGMNGGLGQVVIDLDNNNSATVGGTPESINVEISWEGDYGTGGAAGTTTAHPLALANFSEITRGDVALGHWAGAQTTNGLDIAWHMMMSSDGEELRIFFLRNSVCFAIWHIGETIGFADESPGGTDRPWVGSIWSTTQVTPVEAGSLFFGSGWLHRGSTLGEAKAVSGNGNLVQIIFLSHNGSSDTTQWEVVDLGGGADETNNKQLAGELSLWDHDSVGSRGAKGRMKDIWVCKNDKPIGATFPVGSRQFHQIAANILVPWNGSIPENQF